MSVATHGKEYTLYKISWEKSLDKQIIQNTSSKKQNTNKQKPDEAGESDYHIIYSKCPIFIKNSEACKETRKYGLYTGKKGINRNCSEKTQTLQ